MDAQGKKNETNLRRLRGRVARTRSIGTKVTPDEERQILAAAEAEGKAPSEWARDLLLRGIVARDRGDMEMHLFTELVGIQMLLMNALEPLLRGEKMAQEHLAALYRRVQTTKAVRAQELLTKRPLGTEPGRHCRESVSNQPSLKNCIPASQAALFTIACTADRA